MGGQVDGGVRRVWRERQNDSRPVERGRSKEEKARNKQRWVTCLSPGARVTSRSGLPPKAISRSMVQPQLWSVLVSMAPVTTEVCEARALLLTGYST